MYSSSTSSAAYMSHRSASSRHRSDAERLSSGPLTKERAMMEQIRSKLEKTQRRLAHQQASVTSQHGYNSTRGVPMSMGDTSSSSYRHHHHHHHEYQSSSRHVHSQSAHHHHTSSSTSQHASTAHRSGRAPLVKSVYLEDLAMTINSNQRAPPPSSRVPTSYAPGSGAGPPTSKYYAPPLDESVVRSTHRTATRHVRSQHYEAAPVASQVHIRSERHAVHKLEHRHHHEETKEKSSSHHHHHHHEDKNQKESRRPRNDRPSAPPPSTRGILRKTSSFTDAPPSATMPYYGGDIAPPSSSFDSSNYLIYSSSHDSVPLSSAGYRRPPPSSSGKPDRGVLKKSNSEQTGRSREDNETTDSETSDIVAPPPSSRVRFEDELQLGVQYPPLMEEDEEGEASDAEPLDFLGEELPYDPQDDLEYQLDDDDDVFPYAESDYKFEPVMEIKQSLVDPDASPSEAPVETTDASTSPRRQHRTSSSDEKDYDMPPPPPHRRRGSSAARSPTNLSPSASHVRKSLTEPPKSAIDASLFDQFDMRERRASRERRSSNAGGEKPIVGATSSSTPTDAGVAAEATTKLSTSPIDIYPEENDSDSDFGEAPNERFSKGSLHESDLDSDSDEVPSRSVSPEKLSPSSTDDYCDARAYPEDEEEEEDAQPNQEEPTASIEETTPTTTPADQLLRPNEKNFWEGPDSSEDETVEPELEKPPMTEIVPEKQPEAKASPPMQDDAPANSPPSSPEVVPARPAASVAAALAPPPRQRERPSLPRDLHRHHHHPPPSSRKPMPLTHSVMRMPPSSLTPSSMRPPPMSTHIRPSPATARFSSSMSSSSGVPRAPLTADGSLAGSNYVPRRLRPKAPGSQLRKALPPSIGALSGLASGPVTFELNVASFYEIEWQTGEFGFSFQRVYLEDVDASGAPTTRRMFLRMLLNTERGTCPSFKQVHVGDVLVEIGGTRVCDIKLDKNGGGAALTKLFTELREKTPMRLVFQRMDPTSWEGGVEL